MKILNPKISILCFMLLTSFSEVLPAQNFPASDAWWENVLWGVAGVPLYSYYHLCGDTIIDNTSYQKLYRVSFDEDEGVFESTYWRAIRAEDQQIYLWKNSGEVLLYDFSLEVGDVFPVEGGELVVEETYSQDIGGTVRKFIVFEPFLYYPPEIWIEGIGSKLGLLDGGTLPLGFDSSPSGVCFLHGDISYDWISQSSIPCDLELFSSMVSCSEIVNDIEDVTPQVNLSILPNPASNDLFIHFENGSFGQNYVEIFSISGKRVLAKTLDKSENRIDISHLCAGQYVIRILSENGKNVFVEKLIISLAR